MRSYMHCPHISFGQLGEGMGLFHLQFCLHLIKLFHVDLPFHYQLTLGLNWLSHAQDGQILELGHSDPGLPPSRLC